MKIQQSAEDYLEAILIVFNRNGSVRAIDVANELGYSKPSVSIAMKNLREKGYITVGDGNDISLTASGKAIAERIYERHTILSEWLISIGVTPAVATEDACRMEHTVSEESFSAIKKFLHTAQREHMDYEKIKRLISAGNEADA